MSSSKSKKNQGLKNQNRMLITINVVGSAGPIRFIVNEDDLVCDVIAKALKIYGHEGRLPVLGYDAMDFMLLCPTADSDVLDPLERIGSCGARNFLLCKKPELNTSAENLEKDDEGVLVKTAGKGSRVLKSWINKSVRNVISA